MSSPRVRTGAFTGARRTQERVLLIAGGIGISPLRALLEDLPTEAGALSLIYRASSWDDVVFSRELDILAQMRAATVHYLVGRRGEFGRDPVGPENMARLVPDIVARDVFVCGTPGFTDHVRRTLQALRVPDRQIHAERFSY